VTWQAILLGAGIGIALTVAALAYVFRNPWMR
jgi:hypothetical protein